MGVPLLLRNLQDDNGRIPLLHDYTSPHGEKRARETAVRIAKKGELNSIGIDESIFLHGHTTNHDTLEKNAENIASVIKYYITRICNFFEHYRGEKETKEEKRINEKSDIKIFLSVDGPPPVKKNRREVREEKLDDYSQMSLEKKLALQLRVRDELRSALSNDEKYNFEIRSNHDSGKAYSARDEGEIELIKFAKSQEARTTNVILSSDSDVTAMVILNKLENIVIVSPKGASPCPFISDLQSISDGLKLNHSQLINYVVLHFLFFGSDYNYGLLNCATENRKRVLYKFSFEENIDINGIGKCCNRTKIVNGNEKVDAEILDCFKKLLIVEAICAVLYYASLGERKDLLIETSPLMYLHCKEEGVSISLLVSMIRF